MWGVEGWLQPQSDPVLQMPPRTKAEAPISHCFECVCPTIWTVKFFFRQRSPIRNAVKTDDVQRCFTWCGWAMHCEGTLHLRAAGKVGEDVIPSAEGQVLQQPEIILCTVSIDCPCWFRGSRYQLIYFRLQAPHCNQFSPTFPDLFCHHDEQEFQQQTHFYHSPSTSHCSKILLLSHINCFFIWTLRDNWLHAESPDTGFGHLAWSWRGTSQGKWRL